MRRWLNAVSSRPENEPRELGRWGELQAARYLKQQGYKILYRNFRAKKGGEVDLVCRHGNVLVFVEVKTRSSEWFGRPAAAVDRDKERLIARGALEWLRLLDNPEVIFRFDIVEVIPKGETGSDCRIVEDAFKLPEPYLY